MVKISESRGKTGEGFARIVGHEGMGRLFSKLQSAMIRGGNELEEMLRQVVPDNLHTTLDELSKISNNSNSELPLQVVFKPKRPDPDNPKKRIQADLLIVDNVNRRFTLIEIKDGDTFDTKKSDGELASMRLITSWLAQEFAYSTHYFICAFNQEDKNEIVKGTKKRFTMEHVMTGRELCRMIGVDYDQFRLSRQIDQVENRRYLFTSLLAMPEIRQEIAGLLTETGNLSEPY